MSIDPDKLIETLTQEERGNLYSALTKLRVGAIKIDDVTNTWCVPLSADLIKERTTETVQGQPYMRFKPNKLVILEPSFEKVELETTIETTAAKIEKTWWRTRIIAPQVTMSRTIAHKKVVTVARSLWRVRGLFFGQQVQFPTARDLSGDLFSPDGSLSFPGICEAGLSVTLQVENTSSQAMPFYAVLLGKFLEEAT